MSPRFLVNADLLKCPAPSALRTIPLIVYSALHVALAAPLPQGGQFVVGNGHIAGAGNGLDITQSTTRGVIDWKSFSIGGARTVSIDNGSGATLNRVTGHDLSLIEGQLKATGSVYLINPQGIVVGPHGTITTGGRFVASSLDTTNSTFMADGNLTFTGSGRGGIINLGSISSTGSDVFLISRSLIINAGKIDAAKGSAELDVGSNVLLQDASTGQQIFVDVGSRGTVVNAGSVRAAQISLQAADGNIYAFAGKNGALRATGTTTRDGQVWLVADQGVVHAQGTIAAHDADGTGGTVTTDAKTLDLAGTTVVAGAWNLGSPSLTVNAGSAQALSRSLNDGTWVTATTTGATAGTGNITVGSSIAWKGNASLSLDAAGSVTVQPHVTLSNKGAGNLTLRADAASVDNGGSINNHGLLDWSHSTGIVSALYDMSGTYTPGATKSNPCWSATAFSGLKTQITAYQLVNSIADLENVSENLAGNYALGTNLTAGGYGDPFTAIGSGTYADFTGQFDGMGHTIDNLYMSPSDASLANYGMFYSIGSTGVVRNLNLTNGWVDVEGFETTFGGGVGLLAGNNSGLITYVNTSGLLFSLTYNGSGGGGGLVAVNNGTIERSSSSAEVAANNFDGGLVGENNGLILQSFSTGSVGGSPHNESGGLVGINSGTISQSYSSASGGYSGGGLVDSNYGTITQSYANGNLQDPNEENNVGGIASYNGGTIASNVFWDVDTTGSPTGVLSGNAGPVGLTSAQMTQASSFGPTWNFSTNGVWALPAGATAPVLRWQLAQPL